MYIFIIIFPHSNGCFMGYSLFVDKSWVSDQFGGWCIPWNPIYISNFSGCFNTARAIAGAERWGKGGGTLWLWKDGMSTSEGLVNSVRIPDFFGGTRSLIHSYWLRGFFKFLSIPSLDHGEPTQRRVRALQPSRSSNSLSTLRFLEHSSFFHRLYCAM